MLLNSNLSIDENFELLETMLYYRGKIYLKHYHMQRLYNSIKQLKFIQYSYSDINNIFLNLENSLYLNYSFTDNKYCIRFLLSQNGEINYSINLLSDMPIHGIKDNKIQLVMASDYIDYNYSNIYERNNILWLHKTNIRKHYNKIYDNTKLKYQNTNFSDIVLYNKEGYVTESSRANLAILDKNNLFITPPIKYGLLAGTMRQHLLYSKILTCKPITIEDIINAKYILWFNSLRGIYSAQLSS